MIKESQKNESVLQLGQQCEERTAYEGFLSSPSYDTKKKALEIFLNHTTKVDIKSSSDVK